MTSRRLLLLAGCSVALGAWMGAAQAKPAGLAAAAFTPEAKSTVQTVRFRRGGFRGFRGPRVGAFRGPGFRGFRTAGVRFYGPRRFYRGAAFYGPRRFYRARYWAPRRFYR